MGRPPGSHRKGEEFWPAAGEGTTEDSEKLPGLISTLPSHTGTFETRRQVGGSTGLFTPPSRVTGRAPHRESRPDL